MTTDIDTPIEERIVGVLRQLGIERAHFASRGAERLARDGRQVSGDSCFFAPGLPLGFDSLALTPLAGRLLVFNGDRGGATETINRNMAGLPSASLVTLADCPYADNYTDLAVQRGGDIGPAMLDFMARTDAQTNTAAVSPAVREGEADGIYYKVKAPGRHWCCCRWAQHPPSGGRWRLPSANATVSSP